MTSIHESMASLYSQLQGLKANARSLAQMTDRKALVEDQLTQLTVTASGDVLAISLAPEAPHTQPLKLASSIKRCYRAVVRWHSEMNESLLPSGIRQQVAFQDETGLEDFSDVSITELESSDVEPNSEDPRLAAVKQVLDQVPELGGRRALENSPFRPSGMLDNPSGFQDEIRKEFSHIANSVGSLQDQFEEAIGQASVGSCVCSADSNGHLLDISFVGNISNKTCEEIENDFLQAFSKAKESVLDQVRTLLEGVEK